MANRHMQRCSTWLISTEMQIKTTLRYHLTPVRMAIIKKNTNNIYWPGYGEKGNRIYYWWEGKLVQPLWKPVWRFLKKLKRELDVRSSIPGYVPEKNKHTNRKKCMNLNVSSSVIYNCQDMEAT